MALPQTRTIGYCSLDKLLKNWMKTYFKVFAGVISMLSLATITGFNVHNQVVIENRMRYEVSEVRVLIPGQSLVYGSIKPGEATHSAYRANSEGEFIVSARLSDGSQIRGAGGYVEPGYFGHQYLIVLTPQGTIEVTSR